MKPIYITVGNELPLMVIPDSQAHLDGHTILTYTYSIYKNTQDAPNDIFQQESELHLEKHKNPNYMGFITFENPGHVFTYTDDGHDRLTSDEVEEVIELISHYRDTPRLWSI
jgi:hypothetical protein